MATSVIEILRKSELLSALATEDLETVVASSRLRTFRRGQIVCTTGDPGDTLIVVISGQVKVVARAAPDFPPWSPRQRTAARRRPR